MTDKAYAVWAQKTLGGTKTLPAALRALGSCGEIYRNVHSGGALHPSLSRISPRKLNSFTVDDACHVLEECSRSGWAVISAGDAEYPGELYGISDYPAVLFCEGDVSLLKRPRKTAVVGTRNPCDSGRSTAYKAGLYLSSSGVCIVSGGARGIDLCAHEGAMLGPGGTICVLGCGLGSEYLSNMSYACGRIKKCGLIISENLPFEKPAVYTFPKRNRLISALGGSVLVVECGEKSGALVTAQLCVKQGGSLYRISSSLLDYTGAAKLDGLGAVEVSSAADICGDEAAADETGLLSLSLYSEGLEGRAFLLEGRVDEKEYAEYYHGDIPRDTQPQPVSRKCVKKKALQNSIDEKRFPADRGANAFKTEKTVLSANNIAPVAPAGENEKNVLSCIGTLPVYPDEIADKTGLPIDDVMVSLTLLELDGLIKTLPGNTVILY